MNFNSTKNKWCAASVVAILGLTVVTHAEFRIWEDLEGNVMEGEFVTMTAGQVILRDQQDKKYSFSPQDLCPADQRYLEQAVPPQLGIDVSKNTKSSAQSRNLVEYVVCTVTIKQTDTKRYDGELTAVVAVMGEDIKTGKHAVAERFEDTFTLPEKSGGALEFSTPEKLFSRKTRNAGQVYNGYVVVVWDRFGNPIAIKSNRSSYEDQATELAAPREKSKRTSGDKK